MKRGWVFVLGAVLLVGAGFGMGYAVGDDGHGASDEHGLGNDRMAVMMADGSMPVMMEDFTTMMTQLRESMTPEMRQQMDRDEMWDLMESGELKKVMDEHGASMSEMPGMHGGSSGHQGPGGHGDG
jgi:hypothetical protein